MKDEDIDLLLQAAADETSRQVVHKIAALSAQRRQAITMLANSGGVMVPESEMLEYGRALLAAHGALPADNAQL